MRIKTVAVALLLAASVTAMPAQAQNASLDMPTEPLTAEALEGLRVELRSARKQLMAQNLQLTDDEATRFWPIYDRFQAELTEIKDDQYQLIAEYANTFGSYDSEGAVDFATRLVDLEVRTAALRTRYVPILSQAVSGVTAATFFQIEHRISAMIDQRIASMLPVMQFQNQVAR
jgi:Spy/CpxP family protein refolding chaperone